MAYIDIFNGDADGICALTQWRNAYPVDSVVVTGVKRDIKLVDKVPISAGDVVTVLDISLDRNRAAVERALAVGAEVLYVDHHATEVIPEHPRLRVVINTAAHVCTSILMDEVLEGKFRLWAIAGAFGDNLKDSARALAASLPAPLSDAELDLLERLGTCINYNGYGASLADLHIPPAELFAATRPYASPLAFIAERADLFAMLESGYERDIQTAVSLPPEVDTGKAAVFCLPNEPWARRVSGVFGNELANRSPERAHAVVTENANGTFLISVRAPLKNKTGADVLCSRFPNGGGRKAAAGINDLPEAMLSDFIDQFTAFYA